MEQEKPDILLLDICMPKMSGIEVAEKLKPLKIPFVFLTAYSEEYMVKSAGEVGALGYLIKPIEINRVACAIEVALMRADELTKSWYTIENLTKAVENNSEIDISIGLLMERNQLTQAKAYECLRAYARSHRMKLIEIAKALIAGDIENILSKN